MGLGWELLEWSVLAGGTGAAAAHLTGQDREAVRKADELILSRLRYMPPELRTRIEQERAQGQPGQP